MRVGSLLGWGVFVNAFVNAFVSVFVNVFVNAFVNAFATYSGLWRDTKPQ